MSDNEYGDSTVPYLWRDDGERFSRNPDGTYTMDRNRLAQSTCPYSYTFKSLMDTGVFSVSLQHLLTGIKCKEL